MKALLQLWLAGLASAAFSQTIAFPDRPTQAVSGSEFARRFERSSLGDREAAVRDQILGGNVPAFLHKLCPVEVTNVVEGRTIIGRFFVAPDYLAVGHDEDYVLMPLAPETAQRIADWLDCTLPTRKMVDLIYRAAEVKLSPTPIPPGPQMTTLPVFAEHNEIVRTQRAAFATSHPLGALVAGHKKDVVVSAKLAGATNKVAIYGWHQTNGAPIQPLYAGHATTWVDYSHGIRLVKNQMTVNGEAKTIAQVLADPQLASLISDEGVITNTRYPTDFSFRPGDNRTSHAWAADFVAGSFPGELTREIRLPRGVRVVINAPATHVFYPGSHPLNEPTPLPPHPALSPGGGEGGRRPGEGRDVDFHAAGRTNLQGDSPAKPVLLILYALPNGNTIEQTIGKKLLPGDDWHFDIQHIGAQTRFLRQVLTNRNIVVAYLENSLKSWPAWRREHGDGLISQILETVRDIFSSSPVEIVLTGHSGGGSLTFGFLNTVAAIPREVQRIAFLDSNYAYETAKHADKLAQWLSASPENCLGVLAYDDANALLGGKPFVSAAGGTWGRSHAMLADFGARFTFTNQTNGTLRTHTALGGRIQFLLKENPERKILHTVQVERNGFIHAMLSGTVNEGSGYAYFGERAYGKWIQDTPVEK